MRTPTERLPLLLDVEPQARFTGGYMQGMISGAAKADTPFGPLAGRTMVTVEDFGEDSARIGFMCGPTPVHLHVAGDNFVGLIRALIAQAAADTRQQLEDELDAALGQVAS
jgi:hypothetical protein